MLGESQQKFLSSVPVSSEKITLALTRYKLGQSLAKQGRWEAAIAQYQQALESDPNLSEAQAALDQALAQKETTAQTAIVPSTNTSNGNLIPEKTPEGRRLRKQCQQYARQEQWEEAANTLQQLITAEPSFEAYRDLGRVQARLKQPLTSAQCWYQAFSLKPEKPSAKEHLQLGNTFAKQEQWEKAIACYNWALERDPKLFEAHRNLGAVFARQEKWRDAVAAYRKALALNSDSAIVHKELARALEHQEDWGAAIAAYWEAMIQDPQDLSVSEQLLKLLAKQQDWYKLEEVCRQGIAVHPRIAKFHHWLGNALLRQQREEEAVAAYQEAISLDPEFFWSHNNLGDTLLKLQRWEEAVAAYRSAIALNPNDLSLYNSLGDILHKQGQFDEAIALYEEAIHLEPDKAWFYLKIAELHKQLSNNEKALKLYEKATEVEPKNLNSFINLILLLRQENQLEQALEKCEKALGANTNNQQIKKIQEEIERRMKVKQRAGVLKNENPISLIFSYQYYLEKNADIRSQEVDPLEHYMQQGYKEGRNPHTWFDSTYYLEQNPDVKSADINPLLHYINQGYREGREPHPLFDSSYYLELHPELKEEGINPLIHYVYDNEESLDKSEDATFSNANPTVIDWRKYKFMKKQLALVKETQQASIKVSRPPMISVKSNELEKTAKALKFKSVEKPRVSLLIPVFNEIKYTLECLSSVQKYTACIDYEIIVIDDCSEDESESILREIENITYLRNPENLGFLLSCNQGAKKARGEYLLLLNNDIQVTENWLSPLIETFKEFKDVGLVGPKIIYPNGYLQEAGTRINRDGSTQLIGLDQDPNLPRYNYIREVEYCSGACLLVKTSLFQALGGFDAIYQPAYYEDADMNFRIRTQGYKIYYNPNSTVIHHLSVSSNAQLGSYKMMMIQQNKRKFVQRWQGKLEELNTVRLIAFYLPQFHPVPENNRWWGKGFTEWTNVAKARPNYHGHYQPHIPADLGFYDLRLDQIIDEQAELAAKYGIYGFCYYYYWFAGKRLLDMPLERTVTKNKPNFPFCLAWANENWTRHWNGLDGQVLMAQNHCDEDDVNCILDLIRYFRNDNYIRIHGKPLLFIYRPHLFPDIKRTVEIWRETAWKEGIGDIYLGMVESFDAAVAGINPSAYGFDAAVEFPPHSMGFEGIPPGDIINPNFSGHIYDYRQVPLKWLSKLIPPYTRFRGVMPSWDNTPRQQDKGRIFEYASPGIYQAWLEEAISQTLEQNFGDERIVFIMSGLKGHI